MTQSPTSPDGTRITVRPIKPTDLDRIVLRCWPDGETLDRLFAEQGTIGMAAWEGDKCVAQLHCYRMVLPEGTGGQQDWGANWWSGGEHIFAGWEQWGPRKATLGLKGPVWCHACFHVGRTLETFCMEMLDKFVLPAVGEDAHERQIIDEVKKHSPNIDEDTVRQLLAERRLSSNQRTRGWEGDNEARYFGRGIGTALCETSVRWAREHDYVAVLAPGAADGLIEFARWYGHLPWTTYTKLGFEAIIPPEDADETPGWLRGAVHEPIASEVRNALDSGRPVHELLERVMVLSLRDDVD